MRVPNRRRRGFTLIETVVTVGIVAALAAVVYPQVVKQFDNTDPARVVEDLNNIRTAIETFTVNVKYQPGDIEDLVNQVGDFGLTDAEDRDSTMVNTVYSTSDSTNWNGPYLGITVDTSYNGSNNTVVLSGFGAPIRNWLLAWDINVNATGGAAVAKGDAAADFVALRIDDLSTTQFRAVNDLIDGTGEATEDDKRFKGRFRCPGAVYTSGQACYFLVAPIK